MRDEQTKKEMLGFLKKIGLWNDPRRRFLIPASAHFIGSQGVEDIFKIGTVVTKLIKASDHLMSVAVDGNLNSGGMSFFRRTAQMGIPKNRRKYQRTINGSFPKALKVDLVKGVDGKFYVVEIDAVNTHGLGYGKIFKELEAFLGSENNQFIGTEELLNHSPLEVIVPYHDRFHEGEWSATAKIIETLNFHQECQSKPEDFKGKTILDIHERLGKGFQDKLVEMFLAEELNVLIPPKDNLGSKNILPLAWYLETGELLIKEGCDLDAIKACLPKACFVPRNFDFSDFTDEDWLIKEVNSNAMKGVMSPSEYLARGKVSNFGVILQKKIEQQKQVFRFFDSEGKVCQKELFSRYVVYFKEDGTPLDCLYTATSEELTHGGIGAVMGVCSW